MVPPRGPEDRETVAVADEPQTPAAERQSPGDVPPSDPGDDEAATVERDEAPPAAVPPPAARDQAQVAVADPVRKDADLGPSPGAESERAPEVTAPVVAAPAPVPPQPVAGDRLRLTVVAVRAVDVEVLLDGIGFPRKASLAPGDRKTWKADSLFTFSASDGGAIRLMLAGEDLGVAGPDAAPVNRLKIRRRG